MNRTTTKIWDWLQKRRLFYGRKVRKAEMSNPMDMETINYGQERICEIIEIQNYLLKS